MVDIKITKHCGIPTRKTMQKLVYANEFVDRDMALFLTKYCKSLFKFAFITVYWCSNLMKNLLVVVPSASMPKMPTAKAAKLSAYVLPESIQNYITCFFTIYKLHGACAAARFCPTK